MALSSLFVLMTQNGLEYPNFYEKLYALLVPSIFMAKYRARFFQVFMLLSFGGVKCYIPLYDAKLIAFCEVKSGIS